MNRKKKININDIQLIVYDFDGVMTNNTAILSEDGRESVLVNRSDGLAVSMLRRSGVRQLILSTERVNLTRMRAKKLKIPVLSSTSNKKHTLTIYCKKKRVNLKNVMFVGNDINDLEVVKMVGYPIAPIDAYRAVKENAVMIIKAKGGEGVIRELYDILKGELEHGKE